MGFNFGMLPMVLTKPKEAFKQLGSQTIKEGAMLGAIFAFVSAALSGAIGGQLNVVGWVLGALVGAIMLVVTGWLAAQIAKMAFKGSGNVPNTVGYLAYGNVLGVLSSVVFAVLGLLGMGAVAAGGATALNPAAMMGAASVVGVVGLVFGLWGLYISGSAVGVANGVRTLYGVISGLIATIIVAAVLGAIIAMALGALGLGALMGGAALAGPKLG